MTRRHASLIVAVALLAIGCSAVPNMDSTGSGCANQEGNGPRGEAQDPAGIPLEGIAGLTPAEVVIVADAARHVVVFRQDHLHCVCVAPAGYGQVSEGWWGSRGQLYVDLEGVTPQGVLLEDGTGCRWRPPW
jgi:hypothetical protein